MIYELYESINPHYNISLLHLACLFDKKEIYNLLYINVNITDNDGLTPLHYLCYNNIDEVSFNNCYYFTERIEYPLFKYLDEDYIDKSFELDNDFIQILINEGADINKKNNKGYTPLHFACKYNLNAAKILINNKADVTILDNYYNPPLNIAAKYNHKMVDLLIQNGADLNFKKNMAAIHYASMYNYKSAKILLRYGADVNIRDAVLNTPIYYAILKKDIKMVNLLIENDAKIDVRNSNTETPLHVASRVFSDIIYLLAHDGLHVNIKDLSHRTPMWHAILFQPEAIQLLLDCGANMDINMILYLMKEYNKKYLDIILFEKIDGEFIIDLINRPHNVLKNYL